jgi:hypothetical protein
MTNRAFLRTARHALQWVANMKPSGFAPKQFGLRQQSSFAGEVFTFLNAIHPHDREGTGHSRRCQGFRKSAFALKIQPLVVPVTKTFDLLFGRQANIHQGLGCIRAGKHRRAVFALGGFVLKRRQRVQGC